MTFSVDLDAIDRKVRDAGLVKRTIDEDSATDGNPEAKALVKLILEKDGFMAAMAALSSLVLRSVFNKEAGTDSLDVDGLFMETKNPFTLLPEMAEAVEKMSLRERIEAASELLMMAAKFNEESDWNEFVPTAVAYYLVDKRISLASWPEAENLRVLLVGALVCCYADDDFAEGSFDDEFEKIATSLRFLLPYVG